MILIGFQPGPWNVAEATCEALAAAPPGAGNDWVVLVAIEPVDHATPPGIAIDLDALVAMPGVDLVLVNLGEVSSHDRNGIDMLLTAQRRAARIGVTVAVGHLPDETRQTHATAARGKPWQGHERPNRP